MGPTFRVATINILNDRSRWVERRSLLALGLSELSPDLLALQEVTEPRGESTAHWLAAELGGYSVHVSPKAGWSRAREGIAILSRLPVLRHAVLDLRGQQRTAQSVEVRVGGTPLVFVNGHFHWPPLLHATRTRQVGLVLDWLRDHAPGAAAVVCGDFNGTPDSRAVALMRRQFASAHRTRHGREPDFTCPTPLVTGGLVRSALTRWVLRFASDRPGEPWRGTLDYIFVSPQVRVVECGVFLDRPAPHDPGLYASDHYGLAATLKIDPRGPVS